MTSSPRLVFPFPYQHVFHAAYEAVPGLGMTYRSVDVAQGVILASSSVSLMSWGENIDVRVWALDERTSGVMVSSTLKFGLVAWGRNQKNVDAIVHAMSSRLGAGPTGLA